MPTWGAANNHLRVGVDYQFFPPGHNDTTCRLDVAYYVGIPTDYQWSFDDPQTLNFGGNVGGPAFNYTNKLNGKGVTQFLTTRSYNMPVYYARDGGGSGHGIEIAAQVSGAYNGATPAIDLWLAPPARPAAAPTAPTLYTSSITDPAIPGGLAGATTTWSTVSDEGSNVTAYRIQFATDSGFSSVMFDATGGWDNSASGSNGTKQFTPGQTYWVRLAAINGVGQGAWSGAGSFTVPATAPTAPGTPSASSITSSGVSLSWSAPSTNGGLGIAAYGIQLAKDSAFSSIVHSEDLTGQSKTYSDLSRNTTYYARARAKNSVGYGAWSAATSFGTLSTGPDAPLAPTVSGITPTSANFAWSAPSNGGSAITGYTLQISSHSDFSAAVLTGTYGSSTTSAAAPGSLVPGTTYYARVQASNANGAGAWSPATSFMTLPGIYIGNGTAWVTALMWIGDGTTWKHAVTKAGDGTTWH